MIQEKHGKILVIGYGNPAREDDGLGPAAAAALEEQGIEGVTVEADYQLTVEDAAAVAQHDTVIFIDASADGREPFCFFRLQPKRRESFSSHAVEPEAVLALAEDLFDAHAEAYALGIRGYSFDMFQEKMTDRAVCNLEDALRFLAPRLKTQSFSRAEQHGDSQRHSINI